MGSFRLEPVCFAGYLWVDKCALAHKSRVGSGLGKDRLVYPGLFGVAGAGEAFAALSD